MRDKRPNPNKERARELAKSIAAMSDEERQEFAMRAPVLTVDGRILSGKNQMLAAMQLQTVTMIGGFRQWIGAGRVVKQGESALYIWIPSTRKIGGDAADEGAAGGEIEETRFFLAPVFDVSQTQELAGVDAAAAA